MNEITVITVEPGDTLSAIAVQHGVSVDDVQRWNGIEDPDLLHVGQRIVVCTGLDTRECSASGGAVPQSGSGPDVVAGSWDVWMGGVIVLTLLMFLFILKWVHLAAGPTRRSQNRLNSAANAVSEAIRAGLVRIPFETPHPRHAEVATVNGGTVRLICGSHFTEVPLRDVEAVDVANGSHSSSVLIRHASRTSRVSGLPRDEASSLAEVLEESRLKWWRRALASQLATLRSVQDRVAEFAEPLAMDDRIEAVTFTGSAAVGRRLAGIAGYKKLCLELGGNSPLLITKACWSPLPGCLWRKPASTLRATLSNGPPASAP